MTVKTSISLTGAQHAFAKKLVAKGDFPSVSAVVQSGLESIRKERAIRDAEAKALKQLIAVRASRPTLSKKEFDARIEKMIASARAKYGV
jgi:antitoxin ParD1/3/4